MDEVKEFMNRFSRDFETKFGMAVDDKLEQKVKITLPGGVSVTELEKCMAGELYNCHDEIFLQYKKQLFCLLLMCRRTPALAALRRD